MLFGSLPMFWISFLAASSESIEMNRGLYGTIRGGNRIGLIRTYAHTPLMKGVYILLIKLPNHMTLTIGKLGVINFEEGCYAYIGSAQNGLDQRIQRHLRKQKKIHWHIDYFLNYSSIITVFYKENNKREECKIAQVLEKNFPLILGFGCSDCDCKGHLFYGSSEDIIQVAITHQMKPYPIHTNA